MPPPIAGLHHVTAIASHPQRTLDFYTEVLGLRFVKQTVNFDDPGSYHLYFGNDSGDPGTILTFFAWPAATPGSAGVGETIRTAFRISAASVDYWQSRLASFRIPAERSHRFGEEVLSFNGPDGMLLELLGASEPTPSKPSRFSSVDKQHAIAGFFGVTLAERHMEQTAPIMQAMGFQFAKAENGRHRFSAPNAALGQHIDILVDANAPRGRFGAGSVHHIAFRASDDDTQLAWRETLSKLADVTPVLDRIYFHSIYFREPGGVLFELATDPPGFTVDESIESLGEALKLPQWLEPRRAAIERHLPVITLHKNAAPVAAAEA